MGKKTNVQQILQVGKKNNKYIWDSKYLEKNINESPIYLFQTLEIKKFLKKFLSTYGLHLYKYNINFSESSLKIYISYIKTSKIKNVVQNINTSRKLKLVKKRKNLKKKLYKNFIYRKTRKKKFEVKKKLKNKTLYTFFNFYNIYIKQKVFIEKIIKTSFRSFYFRYELKKNLEKKNFLIKLNHFLIKKYMHYYRHLKKKFSNLIFKKKLKFLYNKYLVNQIVSDYIKIKKFKKLLLVKYRNYLKKLLLKYYNYKKLFKIFLLNKKLYKKRLKTLRYYRNYNKTIKTLNINNFLKRFTESLSIFTKNNLNNVLILQQINQNIIYNLTYRQIQSLKKLLTQLRQFKNLSFFTEGINIILSSLINLNSTNSLVNFIADKLKMGKRHSFFFKFLTKTFSLLLKHKFSKVKSVKIFIKGRINGKPRSKKKIIFINKHMSLMAINSSINFDQSISYSPNGTFGVKLWMNTK